MPHLKIDRMLAVWPEGVGMTQLELCAAAGIGQACVSRYLARMLDSEPRQAHISDWRKAVNGVNQPVAVYTRGPGRDRKCPIKPKGNAASVREYRKRMRKSGDWEDTKARRRDDHWVRKPARRDPLVSAFFGAAA